MISSSCEERYHSLYRDLDWYNLGEVHYFESDVEKTKKVRIGQYVLSPWQGLGTIISIDRYDSTFECVVQYHPRSPKIKYLARDLQDDHGMWCSGYLYRR